MLPNLRARPTVDVNVRRGAFYTGGEEPQERLVGRVRLATRYLEWRWRGWASILKKEYTRVQLVRCITELVGFTTYYPELRSEARTVY